MKFVAYDYNIIEPSASDSVHLYMEAGQMIMQSASVSTYEHVPYISSSVNRDNTYWNITSMPSTHSTSPAIASGSVSSYSNTINHPANHEVLHIKVNNINTMFLSSSTETLHSYSDDGEGNWLMSNKTPSQVTTSDAFYMVNDDRSSVDLYSVVAVSQSTIPSGEITEWTLGLSGATTGSGIIVNKIAW
jgi:hypothetical protein